MISDLQKCHRPQTMVSSNRYVGRLQILWIDSPSQQLSKKRWKIDVEILMSNRLRNFDCARWASRPWCKNSQQVHIVLDFVLIMLIENNHLMNFWMETLLSINNLDPRFLFIINRKNKTHREKLMKEKLPLILVPNQIFAFRKILIRFNIQIYWNLVISSRKLPNDPPSVWHLCQRCVNVPTLQVTGRHLRMRPS